MFSSSADPNLDLLFINFRFYEVFMVDGIHINRDSVTISNIS